MSKMGGYKTHEHYVTSFFLLMEKFDSHVLINCQTTSRNEVCLGSFLSRIMDKFHYEE